VLGLRHGLDADHISAIDLATRRLVAAGKRPVAVGTFFSLGHSTVVVLTCVAVAATSGALRDDERWEGLRTWGGVVGSAVSAVFLVVLCAANGWVLYGLVRKLRARLHHGGEAEEDEVDGLDSGAGTDADADADAGVDLHLAGSGLMAHVFGKTFRLVDAPWKMMPLGMLFGLGFDTSSEIAILGLATLHAVEGTSIWLILIFPILFTGEASRSFVFFYQRDDR
jgi:high-affinity nickel-transport protein